MLTNSRAADSGIKLEVNGKILDSCTGLMHAIRILVKKSRLLQAEIVGQGRVSFSHSIIDLVCRILNFRALQAQKNSTNAIINGLMVLFQQPRQLQWLRNFFCKVSVVCVIQHLIKNAIFRTAADKVVVSNGKLEQLIVAAQEIGASTAQLVVASRVKADRKSENLKQLTQASKGVTTATGTVVATVKDCSQLIEETGEFNYSTVVGTLEKLLIIFQRNLIHQIYPYIKPNGLKWSHKCES